MPNDDNSDVQLALRRMTKIGWINGFGYSPERGFVIDWKEEGVAQIGGLHCFLTKLGKDVDPLLWNGLVTVAIMKFGKLEERT